MQKLALVVALLLASIASNAQNQRGTSERVITKATSDFYYGVGINAYARLDYTTAIKYLFAYELINIDSFNANPENSDVKKVLVAIKACEEKLGANHNENGSATHETMSGRDGTPPETHQHDVIQAEPHERQDRP